MEKFIISLPQTRHKVERGIWAWRLGWQMGTLIGIMKHLIPPGVKAQKTAN
jgi:hypothetical protein